MTVVASPSRRPSVLQTGRPTGLPLLLYGIFILLLPLAAAPWVIYETNFEFPEFEAGILDGQGGWWAVPESEFLTSQIDTNWFPDSTQQALIGGFPPEADDLVSVSAYRPLNVDPVADGRPIVVFSVSLAILDPATPDPDAFRWVVYNAQNGGERLFALDFDLGTTEISFLLDDDPEPYPTQVRFFPSDLYDLTIVMDYASNLWSATLNGTLLVNAAPMTLEGRTLDLGDIDAAWVLGPDSTEFGDAFMLFDDYRVVAEANLPLPCQVEPVQFLNDGSFLLSLFGEPGQPYAIEASSDLITWIPIATNTPGNGTFVEADPEAPEFPRQFYRGRAVWP